MRKRLPGLLYVMIFALYSNNAHAHFGSYMYIPPAVTHAFSLAGTLLLVTVITRQGYAPWLLAYFGLSVLSLLILMSPEGFDATPYMFTFFAPLGLLCFSAIRLWLIAKRNKRCGKVSEEQAAGQGHPSDE